MIMRNYFLQLEINILPFIEGPLNKLLYNPVSLGHTDNTDVTNTYY